MLILVSYDICTSSETGNKRLREVSKVCKNYGVRVQNSVFECVVDSLQFLELKKKLKNIIDKDKDSLRFYNLGRNGRNKVEHIGTKVTIDVESFIIM